MLRFSTFVPGLAGIALLAAQTRAQLLPPIPNSATHIELQTIASSLTSPVYLTDAGDGSGRLFVVDQPGRIDILTPGQPGLQTFLDVSSRLTPLNPNYDERGLLGVAFAPGLANPASPGYRKVYTYATEPISSSPPDFPVPPFGSGTVNHDNVLTEWTVSAVNPDQIDPTSRREILRFAHPQSNHNGGTIAFGPDGYLYLSSGDGGAANDTGFGHNPGGNAQATNTVLGKILRIDPWGSNSTNGQYGTPAANPFNGSNGVKEIYAYGLRNPYRFSFDSRPGGAGDLIVADVGQNNIEEVDRIINGGNYGWNTKEGTFLFNSVTGGVGANSPGAPAGLIDPIAEYDHTQGIAAIGGFVYRGAAIPALDGKYIFGDLSTSFVSSNGKLFALDLTTGAIEQLLIGDISRPLGLFLKGFGQDANGELYVLGSTNIGPSGSNGVVLKIIPVPEPAAAGLLLFLATPLLGLRRPHHRAPSSPAF